MKQVRSTILAIAFLFCLYILFFQAEWLGILIIKNPNFPLGTLISWFMIVDLTFFVYSVFPSEIKSGLIQKLRKSIKMLTVLSLFWGVISFLLSGNWTWTFNNKTFFLIWVVLTSVLVLIPLIILVVLVIYKFSHK